MSLNILCFAAYTEVALLLRKPDIAIGYDHELGLLNIFIAVECTASFVRIRLNQSYSSSDSIGKVMAARYY